MTNKILSYKELAERIRFVFTNLELFQFDKYVPEFQLDNKYAGDVFNVNIFEPIEGKDPVFYHKYSPYDTISNKAPEYAMVVQSGKLLFNEEVSGYTHQRTGVMSALVLQSISKSSLVDKKILFVGTGHIACCSLEAFKELYPELQHVDFVNNGSEAEDFLKTITNLDMEASRGNLENIGEYDIIICHAKSKAPVLTADMLSKIKRGAFISTFASEDHKDIDENFYNKDALVIVDWSQTIKNAADLKLAISNNLISDSEVIQLSKIINNNASLEDKKYTIFRSHGTPMQDLVYLQLVLNK